MSWEGRYDDDFGRYVDKGYDEQEEIPIVLEFYVVRSLRVRSRNPPQPTISGWWTLLEVGLPPNVEDELCIHHITAHGDQVDSDIVALPQALSRVTQTD